MNWLSREEGTAPQAVQSPANSAPQTVNPMVISGGTIPPSSTGSDAGRASGDPSAGGKVETASADSQKEGTVNLSFIGDVMFASKVEDLLKKNGWDYPFQFVSDNLKKADITVANLETPFTTQGTAQSKEYVYRSSPEALPALQAAGIDLVNTANNHIMDYGQIGLLDTLDYLDKAGVKRVGTGRDSDEAYKPVIMERSGVKIAFLGFSRVVPDNSWYAGKNKPGVAGTYSPELPLEAIASAREQADLVVVIAHWGVERQNNAAKEQTDLAHKYIDQGADLVIGSHPHVVQGFEQYKGKWIAYSLGNFIFTTNEDSNTWESMILNAECTKDRNCDLQMTPILTKWAQPVKMTEEDGAKLFDKMGRISINARVDKDGSIVQAPPQPAPAPVPAVVKKATETKKTSGAASGGSTTKSTAPSNGAAKGSAPASGSKTEGNSSTSKSQTTPAPKPTTTQPPKKTEP
ncbi:hypothetical protein CF651_22245 [Paenibacillus rigui]|uniref:Capsule synthesis protein CapA domain-containing protein n=2 Tax=Paenibacillus rigui TaxID=554312 RepID=A0A229UL60_9BACL|nr:hypothetical protein CF651_22245 [Paenibacillus rigui]